jgi:hypothetical protein
MRKQILEELKEMRYLFNYDRGKIISEQNQNLNEMIDLEKGSFGYEDMDDGSEKFPSFSPNGDMDTGEDLAPSFDSDGNFLGMVKPNRDGMEGDEDELEEDAFGGDYKDDLEEEIDFDVPTMMPGTKEKERTITKPGTKPDKDSPYKPKPGPKKNPKAKKGDMPDWLSFDELGINLKQK